MSHLFAVLEDAGKPRIKELESIYDEFASGEEFAFSLVEAIASEMPLLERSGAWMLKRWAERGGAIEEGGRALLASSLDGVESWEARLCLCRLFCLKGWIVDVGADEVSDFLRACCEDSKPFVRAWAIAAFCQLGREVAGFEAEAAERRERARSEETAPSVLARLRHLDEK